VRATDSRTLPGKARNEPAALLGLGAGGVVEAYTQAHFERARVRDAAFAASLAKVSAVYDKAAAEIRGNHMIVITKNGEFSRCKKLQNCDIGDEINIPERNMRSIYKNLTAVAACFLILIMLSSGVYAYYTPYSYISVDMNPSLELYVNRFDRVIEVHAFNDEALQIIKASEGIKNKNVSVALEKILDNAEEAGYLKKDVENSLMIVVSSKNKKEEAVLIDKMSKTSSEVLSNLSSNYEVILEKTTSIK